MPIEQFIVQYIVSLSCQKSDGRFSLAMKHPSAPSNARRRFLKPGATELGIQLCG